MTDEEIVKVLAEKDCPTGLLPATTWPIEDRNALARVIGKMTDEEHGRFGWLIGEAEDRAKENYTWFASWLLTCDPRVIAECVAKAIQKGKS